MEDAIESIDNSFIKINLNDNYFNRSFQIKKDIRRDRNLRDFEYIVVVYQLVLNHPD